MSEQTLDQLRAGDALANVHSLMESGDYGHYVSYVKALPATILTNGLGQALAMLKAQNKNGNPQLYAHLSAWLCREDAFAPFPGQEDALQAIVAHDQATYRQAQTEALAYLSWLKKFAVAYLGEPEDRP